LFISLCDGVVSFLKIKNSSPKMWNKSLHLSIFLKYVLIPHRGEGVCIMPLLRELCSQFTRTRLDKHRTIGENDSWHTAHPPVHKHHILSRFGVLFNVNRFIRNATRIKPAFRHTAITTPCRHIHLDRVLFSKSFLHK